jgi:putative nucleotidyltransferase with HDIG domain
MLRVKRSKLLHHVLLVLLVVSIGPLSFYGWQLIQLNREKLETNEKLSQLIIAKSLAREIAHYLEGYREQILGFASAVELTGLDNSQRISFLQKKLEEFVTRSKNLLYINIVNNRGKGVRAGRYNADDPVIQRIFQIAYLEASKADSYMYVSAPKEIELGDQRVPVIIMATPVRSGAGWSGATTVVLGLDDILHWVTEYSTAGKTVYVVDFSGRIVAHPRRDTIPAGMDFSRIEIVREFIEAWNLSKGNVRLPGTRPFKLQEGGKDKEMLGTYYPIPEASWGVIVQIDQKDAFAMVTQMKAETIKWGILMLLLSLLVGSVSARSITTPIQQLAESTRSIARGDFSKKIKLRTKTEIGELAETFNKMTDDLEAYIQQIKRAAKENHDLFLKNRDLFLGTIRALAAAIDEKDPYTRGHSERVTEISLILGKHLGMSERDLETLQIAALLHDVGKIGIDDNVLKKPGFLTPDEFELMKQHPVKGANIMRTIEQMREMIPGMKHHHEQWDGNGYPERLKGKEIPLIARIISVADTFDAMTTNRPYQKAIDLDLTLQKIQQNAGIKFDAAVVSALISALASGEITLTLASVPAQVIQRQQVPPSNVRP